MPRVADIFMREFELSGEGRLRGIWGWMEGRKTYALAGIVFLAVLGLTFAGRLTPSTASTVALFAVSGFAMTFRSALGRHQAEQLAILQEIAAAGLAARQHNRPAAVASLVQAAEQGAQLAGEVSKEGKV
jgi:hypothetical protein